MSWGIRCRSASGRWQINSDDDFACMQLAQKGQVTCGTNIGTNLGQWGGTIRTGSINYTGGQSPICVLRFPTVQTTSACGLLRQTFNGAGSWTFKPVVACGDNVTLNGTLDYFIFDRPRPKSGFWGTRVKRNGALLYSSHQPLMRVVDDMIVGPGTFAGTAGRSYAAAVTAKFESNADVEQLTDMTWQTHWSSRLVGGRNTSGGFQVVEELFADGQEDGAFDPGACVTDTGDSYWLDPQGGLYFLGQVLVVDVTDL